MMETNTFRRLGSNKTLTADARFVAARPIVISRR
ncbi:MAG: hypothetical protein IPO00_03215 [Betaproteobacteria bacterium]|nr:hypothetical protein [Betaproteobacteria bacterium]